MKRMLIIFVWPIFILGMQKNKIPLAAVIEKFKTISPDAPDKEYVDILEHMRRHGMSLSNGISRAMRERKNGVFKTLKKEWGIADREIKKVQSAVEFAKVDYAPGEVSVVSFAQLPLKLARYIGGLFSKKGCPGNLEIWYEPNSSSLIRLDDDVEAQIGTHGSQSNIAHKFSSHRLLFNNQFVALEPSIQHGFIQHMLQKIVDGHALWGAIFAKLIVTKHPEISPKQLQESNFKKEYQIYLALSADAVLAQVGIESAAQIEAMYDLYEKDSSFTERRNSAKRLHRFMQLNEQLKSKKKK